MWHTPMCKARRSVTPLAGTRRPSRLVTAKWPRLLWLPEFAERYTSLGRTVEGCSTAVGSMGLVVLWLFSTEP